MQREYTEYMKVKDIKKADFNPTGRTERVYLRGLLDDIRKNGIITPLIVDMAGNLADGHRRLACAEILGMENVPVRRVSGELGELWASCNANTMKVSGRNWAEATVNGLSIEAIPQGKVRQELTNLIRIMGDDMGDFIALDNTMPGIEILRGARVALRYCGMETDDANMRRIVWWLRKHKMQSIVSFAVHHEIPATTLVEAIYSDKPLSLSVA